VDRITVELSALSFQAVVTALLALVSWRLWRQSRRPYFAAWTSAWALYALRIGFISAYIVHPADGWLLAHQAATGLVALLLLLAALQFSQGVTWHPRLLSLAALPIVWAWIATQGIHDHRLGSIVSVAALSAVTLWTGIVFLRHGRRTRSPGAFVLAATFLLWGLHHLDYPLLRPFGTAVLYGAFADVLFIVATALGTLFLVLGDGRRALEARTAQLEQLTGLLLRAQEDERRRIARELHDEAGQVLTAVKIELDLDGRREASAMVSRALAQVRDLSNLLRPAALDDLGLVPALRSLLEDFGRRTRIDTALDASEPAKPLTPELEVVIYRVVQEALTNTARHAEASRARVRLAAGNGDVTLVVEDDGRGVTGELTPHLGLLGIRERVAALGGSVAIGAAPGSGFRLEARIPDGRHA
jgi:signal transduction histidine kinase